MPCGVTFGVVEIDVERLSRPLSEARIEMVLLRSRVSGEP